MSKIGPAREDVHNYILDSPLPEVGKRRDQKTDGTSETPSTGAGSFAKNSAAIKNQQLPNQLDYPHNGKHRPPNIDEITRGKIASYEADPEAATNALAKWHSGTKKPAFYNTQDAAKVLSYEDEARQQGLSLYGKRGTPPEALTQVHKFGQSIGVDQGEKTSTVRLDGDHGHPIQENNPQQNTSFSSYVKGSAANAIKDKTDAVNKGKDAWRAGDKDAVMDARKDWKHADNWLNTAHDYLTTKGLRPEDYGLNPTKSSGRMQSLKPPDQRGQQAQAVTQDDARED
jgi:hypothetical protein